MVSFFSTKGKAKQGEQNKESENLIVVDWFVAEKEASELTRRFLKAKSVIEWLEGTGKKMHWDILWDALKTGKVQEAYIERHAKEHYLNFKEVEVRNDLREMYKGMSDAFERYRFPQKYVLRNEDGSFYDIDKEKIMEDFVERNTYIITKEIFDVIDSIKKAKEAGINTDWISDNIRVDRDSGKAAVDYTKIARIHQIRKKNQK